MRLFSRVLRTRCMQWEYSYSGALKRLFESKYQFIELEQYVTKVNPVNCLDKEHRAVKNIKHTVEIKIRCSEVQSVQYPFTV